MQIGGGNTDVGRIPLMSEEGSSSSWFYPKVGESSGTSGA